MSFVKVVKSITALIARIVLVLFIFSVFLVIIYRFLNPPVTILMIQRCFEQAADPDREVRLDQKWIDYEDIAPSMVRAVMTSEDQNFLKHSGFDFEAINKAIEYNERKRGKKVRGASTISQQTAKNVFLWPDRSWLRKGLEVYFTFMIEIFWSKKRILEVYLNIIEFGDGVYGIEAASQYYFKKSAKKLNMDQSALIAVCLPNPLIYSPVKPSGYIKRKQRWVIRNSRYIAYPKFGNGQKQ